MANGHPSMNGHLPQVTYRQRRKAAHEDRPLRDNRKRLYCHRGKKSLYDR